MASVIRIREGLLERLRETRKITSEEAQARLIGCDRHTLRRVDAGSQPSGSFMAGLCEAFGLGIGEAFEVVRVDALDVTAASVTRAAA